MPIVRPIAKPAERRDRAPLLLGACVLFHSKDVTGIVVGSVDSSPVRVRWETTCLRAKLVLVR
jgi:hypothetical protein